MLEASSGSGGNHTIFCLDASYSMGGARWSAAINAIDGFQTELSKGSSDDRVSTVVFAHYAKIEVENEPLCGGRGRIRCSPFGGTAYAPAWREVQHCAELTTSGCRVVVVFITDGFSNDIGAAASIAQSMYNKFAPLGGMVTFVVSVDEDFDRANLLPIVKAGNGGSTTYNFGPEKVQLQVATTTGNIMSKFRLIASNVSLRQSEIKCNLKFVATQRDETQKQHQQAVDAVEATYKQMSARHQSALESLEQCAMMNAKEKRAYIDEQLAQNASDKKDIETQLSNITAMRDDLLKQRTDMRDYQIPALEESLACTKDNHEKMKKQLTDLQCTEGAAQLEKLSEKKKRLLENVGTSNENAVTALVKTTEQYLKMRRNNQIIAGDNSDAFGNLVSFAEMAADFFARPLCSEPPALSKADFIFEYYRNTQNLPIKQPMRSIENLNVVVKHLAGQMAESPNAEDIKCLVSTFTASDLCDISRDVQDLKQKKETCTNQLKERFAQTKPRLRKIVSKINAEDRKRKEAQEKLDDIEEKLEKLAEAQDTNNEKQARSLTKEKEKLENQVANAKRAKNDAEKDKHDALLDYQPALDLLNHVLEDFHQAYWRHRADLEMSCLQQSLCSFMQDFVNPMKDFVATVEKCKMAVVNDALRPSLEVSQARQSHESEQPQALTSGLDGPVIVD